MVRNPSFMSSILKMVGHQLSEAVTIDDELKKKIYNTNQSNVTLTHKHQVQSGQNKIKFILNHHCIAFWTVKCNKVMYKSSVSQHPL